MLLERLLDNLSVGIEPFALCEVERGCELSVDKSDSVTLHFVLSGTGTMRVGHSLVYITPMDA